MYNLLIAMRYMTEFIKLLFCYSGVLPANTSLTVHDLDDVRQIDSLIRTHVLLAELAGHDSPCYKDYLLMAQTYILRLLQVQY